MKFNMLATGIIVGLLGSSAALAQTYECKVTDVDGKKTGEEVNFTYEPRLVTLKSAPGADGKTTEQVLVDGQKILVPAQMSLDHATISLANMPTTKSFEWHYKSQAEGHVTLDLNEMTGDFSSSHTSPAGLKLKTFSFVECKEKK